MKYIATWLILLCLLTIVAAEVFHLRENFEEPAPERPLAGTYFELPGAQGRSTEIRIGTTQGSSLTLQSKSSLRIEPKHEALVQTSSGQRYVYRNNTLDHMTVDIQGKMLSLDIMPLQPIPNITFKLSHNGKFMKWNDPVKIPGSEEVFIIPFKLNKGEAAIFEMTPNVGPCPGVLFKWTYGTLTRIRSEQRTIAGVIYPGPDPMGTPCNVWEVVPQASGGFFLKQNDQWLSYNQVSDEFEFGNNACKFFIESVDRQTYELSEIRRKIPSYHI